MKSVNLNKFKEWAISLNPDDKTYVDNISRIDDTKLLQKYVKNMIYTTGWLNLEKLFPSETDVSL